MPHPLSRLAPLSFAVLLVAATGCGQGTAPNPTVDAGNGCQPCGANLGCDTATRTCVLASQAGGYCGSSAPDGGPTACVDGTTCGPVADGASVCAKPCASSADCGTSQGCFSNPANVPARQYCANEVAVGAACSIDQLEECTGANGAVAACLGNAQGGICYDRCDATVTCPTGKNCSAAFSDGAGVCVIPTMEGSACNESNPASYVLCSAGQVCVVGGSGAGTCHLLCGPDAGSCAGPETCSFANPCDPVEGFCVTPVASGASCNAADGQYCDPANDCVDVAAGPTCEVDCTNGESCGAGTSCGSLPATDGGFTCRKACF